MTNRHTAHRTDFRFLLVGLGVTDFGASVTGVALPLLAIQQLSATPFEVSTLMAVETVPWLLTGLAAGVWIERWPKRRVLVISSLARAVTFGLIPLLWLLGALTYWSLLPLIFAAAIAAVFAETAAPATIPLLVERSQLVRANSRLSAIGTGSSLSGEGLGGIIVAAAGGAMAMGVEAVTSLVSAASFSRITAPTQQASGGTRSFLHELREGVAFAFGDPVLRSITMAVGLQNLLVAARYALVPLFLVTTLHTSEWLVGFLLASWAVGSLLGGLAARPLAARWGSGVAWRRTMVVGSAFGLGVPLAFPGAGLVVFTLCALGASACAAVGNVMTSTARQALCPPTMLARLSATIRTLTWGLIPIGVLLGGALGSQLGIRPALVVVSVALIAPWFVVRLGPLAQTASLEGDGEGQSAKAG